VKISISNKSKVVFLEDKLAIDSGAIEYKIRWDSFEHIEITIIEKATTSRWAKGDSYNEYLLKRGPRSLMKLIYSYDATSKKFIRRVGDTHSLTIDNAGNMSD
jgi:hypothetical protein